MRPLAILPVLCAVVAFVLSMLAIFAGSKPGLLEDYELLTLNSTKFGQTFFDTQNKPDDQDGDAGLLSDIGDAIGDKVDELEQDVKNGINGAIGNLTRALNIHDWYSAHIMNYCEGYYVDDGDKNTTKCSNRTTLYNFDPKAIIQEELRPPINITDLKYPDAIDEAVKQARTGARAMFVLYCIGAALSALAIITGVVSLFLSKGRAGDALNAVVCTLAFLALGIAAAISTAGIVKAVDAINKNGNDIGLVAYKGKKFLALVWAATALMLVATFVWLFDCCMPRRKTRTYREKTTVHS